MFHSNTVYNISDSISGSGLEGKYNEQSPRKRVSHLRNNVLGVFRKRFCRKLYFFVSYISFPEKGEPVYGNIQLTSSSIPSYQDLKKVEHRITFNLSRDLKIKILRINLLSMFEISKPNKVFNRS